MRRILITTSYLSGQGGIERAISNMCGVTKDKLSDVVNVEVLSLSGGENVEKRHSKIIANCGNENWLSSVKHRRAPLVSRIKILTLLYHAFFIISTIISFKPDSIVCTGAFQVLVLSTIKKIVRNKFTIFYWPHFSIESDLVNKKIIRKSDRFLAISQGIKNQLKEVGIAEENIYYFPNFFENKYNLVDKYINNSSKLELTYIGRFIFEGQKRLKDLVDAIKLVADLNIMVTMIGDGKESDYLKLINKINNEKINDKFNIIRKWTDDPWQFVSKSDALILTSSFEGLPTVLGEAISRGIKVISSDCDTGPRDFVKSQNGDLYKVGEVTELASLIRTYSTNEKNYDRNVVAESISFLYDESYIDRFLNIFGRP